MNPLKGLAGLAAIVAIFITAFYAYSNLSRESGNPPVQTAVVSNSISDGETGRPEGEKVAVSPSTTTPSRPNLEGFKEKEIREGLDNIKAGLDLLENPF